MRLSTLATLLAVTLLPLSAQESASAHLAPPGLLPYIWVDDIQATVASLGSHGAEIVDSPHPDHPDSTSTIATFRDPAGNLMGLYQEQA